MIDLIAYDSETGGFRPGKHALLSMAARTSWDSEPFSVHLWPADGYTVEPEAAEKNGFTIALWRERGAVTLLEGMDQFKRWLTARLLEKEGARMLAHNSGHDSGFLDEAQAITGIRLPIRHSWRCSMQKLNFLMDLDIIPQGRATLDRLGTLSGLWPEGCRPAVHEAGHDAEACLHGYLWLLERVGKAKAGRLLDGIEHNEFPKMEGRAI